MKEVFSFHCHFVYMCFFLIGWIFGVARNISFHLQIGVFKKNIVPKTGFAGGIAPSSFASNHNTE